MLAKHQQKIDFNLVNVIQSYLGICKVYDFACLQKINIIREKNAFKKM